MLRRATRTLPRMCKRLREYGPLRAGLSSSAFDENVLFLRDAALDKEVFVVGTAHVSRKSAEQVREVIRIVRPSSVMIELCEPRYKRLLASDWREDSSSKPPELLNTLQRLASQHQGGMSEAVLKMFFAVADFIWRMSGLRPGLEFKVASDEAGRLHSQLVLGDIEGDTTLRNLSQALLPMITRLLSVSLSGKSDPLTLLQRLKDTGMRLQPGESLEDMIERQKNRAVFREFRNKFEPLAPEFFEVMLNVRDARMVSALRNECKGPRVVGVVGLAHLDGIERRWRELQARELGASSATAALEREEAA